MKEKNTKSKALAKNDIILIVGLLLVSALVLIYLFVFRAHGNTVKVTVDGKTYGVYSLSKDMTEDICTGDDGEHKNRLVIKNGKAFVESATCPDGICVSHKAISRDGESIVCLPNRVVITVITSGNDDEPDIII